MWKRGHLAEYSSQGNLFFILNNFRLLKSLLMVIHWRNLRELFRPLDFISFNRFRSKSSQLVQIKMRNKIFRLKTRRQLNRWFSPRGPPLFLHKILIIKKQLDLVKNSITIIQTIWLSSQAYPHRWINNSCAHLQTGILHNPNQTISQLMKDSNSLKISRKGQLCNLKKSTI